MNVTINRTLGGHDAGATITVLDSVGERLIDRGVATEDTTDSPKRTRRGKAATPETDKADAKTVAESDKADEEGGGDSPSPSA